MKSSIVTVFFLLYSTVIWGNQSNQQSWDFKVYLEDDFIGTHRFEISQNGTETKVNSKARFNVRFLFISVFDYAHNNSEVWQQNCLQKLESTTSQNDEHLFVRLYQKENHTSVNTPGKSIKADRCLASFAYWDINRLKRSTLINPQTGEIVAVHFEQVSKPDQNRMSQYRLTGPDIQIDLWYDQNGKWVALQSLTQSGKNIRYQIDKETQHD